MKYTTHWIFGFTGLAGVAAGIWGLTESNDWLGRFIDGFLIGYGCFFLWMVAADLLHERRVARRG